MVDIRYLFENLFVNKYDLTNAKRISTNTLFVQAAKRDEFGRIQAYDFYFFGEVVDEHYVEKFKQSEFTIMVGVAKTGLIDFTLDEFFEKLQTVIDPGIYLRDDISEVLDQLGHNVLPQGMSGDPADLFEIYSKESLQFMFGGKARRYGKDRAFESVPDGAVISVKSLSLLFDAKAYKDGYNTSADDLKRFESYINEFNGKYAGFTNRIFSFLVLSGHFTVGDEALEDRAKELYSKCQTVLTFISVQELGESIKLLKLNAGTMQSINWKKILVNPVYKTKYLKEQINSISKDKIF